MAAGNVSHGCDHDADGQAVRCGDAQESHATLARGGQILVGADRTGPYENQSERADEFSDELLRKSVHVAPKPSARILLNWRERVKE